MQKTFPIHSDSACLLKWAWSTVYFNSGTSASCHRTQKYAIDPGNFDNFHNLPDKISARQMMLQGQWPRAGCEYCKQVEDTGGVSDRQYNLQQQQGTWLTPPELLDNATATNVTPTILEVYFKNTCNMKCVYCGPHFSSQWEDENRKFNKSFETSQLFDIKQTQHNPNYDQMVQGLWNYLEDNDRYKTLRRYHILGGEPFLMSELDDSIDFWKRHPNPDLVFSIVTNLNIPTARFEKYVQQFERLVMSNKIWKLQLTASLDCWGSDQEYVRYGLDLELWERNFELLLNRPWVALSINSAISALTIKSMPGLLEKINAWNTKQVATANWHQREWAAEPILHSFNTTGQYDDPYQFGPGVFDKDFKRILELMPDTPARTVMAGIAQQLAKSNRNNKKIENLKMYLSELDQRRGTNWRSQFAWLDQDFSV